MVGGRIGGRGNSGKRVAGRPSSVASRANHRAWTRCKAPLLACCVVQRRSTVVVRKLRELSSYSSCTERSVPRKCRCSI